MKRLNFLFNISKSKSNETTFGKSINSSVIYIFIGKEETRSLDTIINEINKRIKLNGGTRNERVNVI